MGAGVGPWGGANHAKESFVCLPAYGGGLGPATGSHAGEHGCWGVGCRYLWQQRLWTRKQGCVMHKLDGGKQDPGNKGVGLLVGGVNQTKECLGSRGTIWCLLGAAIGSHTGGPGWC